jgi:hypothetical protein
MGLVHYPHGKVADFLGQRKQGFERDLLSIEVAQQP